ncbi:hypothetical protein Tco_1076190, partial [Tanacetum coccineum]
VEIKKAEPKKASNPPFVSRSRSRSFPDRFSGYFSGYDGAYDSFDGRYGPGPIRASRVPGIVDGYNPYRAPGWPGSDAGYRRYAPWRAMEGPGIANGSRYAPYGAPGGTGSGYGPYGPERVGYYGRYGKGSGIGGYGDCDGYLGESSRGDASRFGSGDEHDLYRGSKIRAGWGPDSGPAASYGGSYGSGGYSGGFPPTFATQDGTRDPVGESHKGVHGRGREAGKAINSGASSCWTSIVREVEALKTQGVNFFEYLQLNMGNGESATFWEDRWLEGILGWTVRFVGKVGCAFRASFNDEELSTWFYSISLTPKK